MNLSLMRVVADAVCHENSTMIDKSAHCSKIYNSVRQNSSVGEGTDSRAHRHDGARPFDTSFTNAGRIQIVLD